jgi:hypothetical protein
MRLDIKIKEIPEQPTLTIRESANMASIPERMGKIFSDIMMLMGKKRDSFCRRPLRILA